MTLTHVTLTTGHVRASPRSEVADAVVDSLGPRLDRLLAGERVPLPELGAGYSMHGTAEGRSVLLTVSAADHLVGHAPLTTVGIQGESDPRQSLWRLLHQHHAWPLATSADRPPPAPWCAARIESGALLKEHQVLPAIADLERCIAWALLDRWARLA